MTLTPHYDWDVYIRRKARTTHDRMVYYVHLPSQRVYFSRNGDTLQQSITYPTIELLDAHWRRVYRMDMKLPDGI